MNRSQVGLNARLSVEVSSPFFINHTEQDFGAKEEKT